MHLSADFVDLADFGLDFGLISFTWTSHFTCKNGVGLDSTVV